MVRYQCGNSIGIEIDKVAEGRMKRRAGEVRGWLMKIRQAAKTWLARGLGRRRREAGARAGGGGGVVSGEEISRCERLRCVQKQRVRFCKW